MKFEEKWPSKFRGDVFKGVDGQTDGSMTGILEKLKWESQEREERL